MKKINIIKESKDFDKAFRKRNQVSSKYTYTYINDNNISNYRFGICVSKKLGKAVERNLIKRRVKDIIDKLTANLNKTVVFFADVVGDKIIFIAKQKNTSFVCGNLVKEAAIIAGGNGGGRPDFAQAGGKDVSKVDDALAKINNILGL